MSLTDQSLSEKLHKDLNTIVEDIYSKNILKCDDFYKQNENEEYEEDFEENFPIETQNFKTTFEKLFITSINEKYYWQYCSFDTYTESFDKRIDIYIKQYYPDVKEIDFIEEEISIYQHRIPWFRFPSKDSPTGITRVPITECLDRNIRMKIIYSNKRKYEFLALKLKLFKNSTKEEENNSSEENDKQEYEYIDYSECSHPERFVMIHELGIIDYLKGKIPVHISERQLAALLSTFTGINKDNLRSMINGTKNNNQNNKINNNSILNFQSKLRELKIDPLFFKKE